MKPTRRTSATWIPPGAIGHLRTGHDFFRDGFGDDPDIELMRLAWQVLRSDALEAQRRHHRVGWPRRPWAWWVFDQDEDPPCALDPTGAEALRLLELGELDDDELARLPRLIRREMEKRRVRCGMDSPESYVAVERLAERLGIEGGGDGD